MAPTIRLSIGPGEYISFINFFLLNLLMILVTVLVGKPLLLAIDQLGHLQVDKPLNLAQLTL
jgi:hypothetical protein